MKILLYLFLVAISFILIFFINNSLARKQGFFLYGGALVLLPVLAFLIMIILKVSGFQPGPDFKGFFFGIFLALGVIILANLAVLTGDFILNNLIGFQQQHNAANTDRFPVSFAVRNKNNIMLTYRVLFFLGTCLQLYGTCFDMKH